MKLEKKTIYEFIKASDELPEIEYDKNIPLRLLGSWNNIYSVGRYPGRFVSQSYGSVNNDDVEWLKPIKDVFVLTFDELNVFIKEFNIFLVQKGNPDNSLSENTNEFIKSLTK